MTNTLAGKLRSYRILSSHLTLIFIFILIIILRKFKFFHPSSWARAHSKMPAVDNFLSSIFLKLGTNKKLVIL